MSIRFDISDEDQVRIQEWLKDTVYPQEIKKQKKAFSENKYSPLYSDEKFKSLAASCWDKGIPYQGAIGED